MNLTSAANSILPSVSNEITCTSIPPNTESAHIDMDVNADTTVIPSTITSSGVLSKDVAIDMIQAARWWSPDLTCNPEPLSSLLSNNAKKESGWLRNLLFPSTTMNERSQYQQDLTLSYLLTFAENKGLAGEVATAWGMSLESAIKTRKATVFAAGMCYPVNKVIIEISSKGRDAMLDLLDEYPHGCLRPTWKYNSVGHIQVSWVAITFYCVFYVDFVPLAKSLLVRSCFAYTCRFILSSFMSPSSRCVCSMPLSILMADAATPVAFKTCSCAALRPLNPTPKL